MNQNDITGPFDQLSKELGRLIEMDLGDDPEVQMLKDSVAGMMKPIADMARVAQRQEIMKMAVRLHAAKLQNAIPTTTVDSHRVCKTADDLLKWVNKVNESDG